MRKKEVLETIHREKLVPVVRTATADLARKAIDLLAANGISVIELTLTTPNAVEIIREYSADQNMLTGAGTVLNVDQARECVEAGAKFIVSPIFDRQTVEYCKTEQIAVIPAGITPTEVYRAWEAGADAVKIFPAGSAGGPAFIKALKSVFPEIRLIPTGGVSTDTIKAFLDAGAFAAGAGTDLIDNALLASGDTDAIAEKIKLYRKAVA